VLGLEEGLVLLEDQGARGRHRSPQALKGSKALTLKEWADTWTSDPLYSRPKASTNMHNAERISRFVDAHGHVPLNAIGDEHVAKWIAGGRNVSTVPALKAMFNDAASAKAGRLSRRTRSPG
jgi:hypothetical protein